MTLTQPTNIEKFLFVSYWFRVKWVYLVLTGWCSGISWLERPSSAMEEKKFYPIFYFTAWSSTRLTLIDSRLCGFQALASRSSKSLVSVSPKGCRHCFCTYCNSPWSYEIEMLVFASNRRLPSSLVEHLKDLYKLQITNPNFVYNFTEVMKEESFGN